MLSKKRKLLECPSQKIDTECHPFFNILCGPLPLASHWSLHVSQPLSQPNVFNSFLPLVFFPSLPSPARMSLWPVVGQNFAKNNFIKDLPVGSSEVLLSSSINGPQHTPSFSIKVRISMWLHLGNFFIPLIVLLSITWNMNNFKCMHILVGAERRQRQTDSTSEKYKPWQQIAGWVCNSACMLRSCLWVQVQQLSRTEEGIKKLKYRVCDKNRSSNLITASI